MADDDAGDEGPPRCAACGGRPTTVHELGGSSVALCPACAAAEGLGCP